MYIAESMNPEQVCQRWGISPIFGGKLCWMGKWGDLTKMGENKMSF